MYKITKSNKYIIIFFAIFILSCKNNSSINLKNSDSFYEKCRKLVLSENIKGQEYFFRIKKKEIDEFKITYLGDIKTKNGDTLRFLNAVNYYGNYDDAKHAKGYVFIYNTKGNYLGCYYVGGELGVPSTIEGTTLVFSYNNENCNQTTRISFIDSIPQQIFIKCTEKGGDFYSFTKE